MLLALPLQFWEHSCTPKPSSCFCSSINMAVFAGVMVSNIAVVILQHEVFEQGDMQGQPSKWAA